jgi:hypothetical protein
MLTKDDQRKMVMSSGKKLGVEHGISDKTKRGNQRSFGGADRPVRNSNKSREKQHKRQTHEPLAVSTNGNQLLIPQ